MGVMRRPTGIYVPTSPIRLLTTEMISPPLSPDFTFDSEAVLPTILPALEYISSKLQQRMMHVTLLVGRGKPFPTGQASDLMVIPITKLDLASTRVLERAIAKGARKFSLGTSWSEALDRSHHERLANEYLVQQSILQNEVLFSQEGLTLLNMDRIYTFKRRLCVLSAKPNPRPEDQAMTSAVTLLHRLMGDFQGRPFSKAFFHRVYEQLDVRDELLTAIASAYKNTHKTDAIIIPSRFTAANSKNSPIRLVRVRRNPPPAKSSTFISKRGPKTPLSASDVTPITRNEWNMLVAQDIHEIQPTVTKWTPSATVYVGA
ncbi:hypothetical protein N7520_008909 [Penicillium odoratum]|uniref:uncharacterized protein n=1 Tax=Penicillium odoratum TaxID=1167516 RepID=UPI0025489C74|nr:uncharacterized protein N7520_008909 [Penicillium odoratum]KAJ5751992.1 hypothetical protein N7520_008909 [Penicillium odoratum]